MSAAKTIAELDDRDRAILQHKLGLLLENDQPKVGDYVKFADGVERRISHVWDADWHDDGIATVQTSESGSFYLGDGYCSFSGGLHLGVKVTTLMLTGQLRRGSCWFFHHNHRCAHNGVDVDVPVFAEWTCELEATR